MVHGAFYELGPEGTPSEVEHRQRAVAALRALLAETLRDRDPSPHRSIVFRIAIQDMAGRASLP
ncbi:MAG: hypothetical protein HY704_01975 [Gemmatimonadetes bacterium]|nr:hypothetical protein [Gemmatimonadota bacterium]